MNRVALDGLLVIGYADRVTERTAPAIVPPIFVASGGLLIIMPPLTITAGYVSFNVRGTIKDLERAIRNDMVTKLEKLFVALPQHTLWIDADLKPRYQPTTLVRSVLRRMSRIELRLAQVDMDRGDINKALKRTGNAIGADDSNIEAYRAHAHILRQMERYREAEVVDDASKVCDVQIPTDTAIGSEAR